MSIYISLTTVPKRVAFWESFKQNLQSLVNQKTNIIGSKSTYIYMYDHN